MANDMNQMSSFMEQPFLPTVKLTNLCPEIKMSSLFLGAL